MTSDRALRKPFSLRWSQRLWAALSRTSKKTGWPLDIGLIRLLMLLLMPLYIKRLGLIQGLSCLYRFLSSQGGFTLYRSDRDLGLFIREDSNDALVFQQIFILGDYRKLNRRTDVKVIIDAGAYVGYTAIYFAELYPHAFIYALEPEESNFQALQKNTRNYPNILPIQAALWHSDTTLEVRVGEAGQWSCTVHESEDPPKNRRIASISLQTLIAQYRLEKVDILKIDIEGSEVQVFDPNYCHEWLPQVQTLSIELHEQSFPGSEKNFFAAMDRYQFDLNFAGENLLFDFHHEQNPGLPKDKPRYA
jgi:FkbM family methyltransferase